MTNLHYVMREGGDEEANWRQYRRKQHRHTWKGHKFHKLKAAKNTADTTFSKPVHKLKETCEPT